MPRIMYQRIDLTCFQKDLRFWSFKSEFHTFSKFTTSELIWYQTRFLYFQNVHNFWTVFGTSVWLNICLWSAKLLIYEISELNLSIRFSTLEGRIFIFNLSRMLSELIPSSLIETSNKQLVAKALYYVWVQDSENRYYQNHCTFSPFIRNKKGDKETE